MARLRHLSSSLLVLALMAAPSIAAACPSCVGQNKNTNVLKIVGVFMLVPFGIFYFVLRTIRRATRESKQPIPPLD